jgi:hypothetical protein
MTLWTSPSDWDIDLRVLLCWRAKMLREERNCGLFNGKEDHSRGAIISHGR